MPKTRQMSLRALNMDQQPYTAPSSNVSSSPEEEHYDQPQFLEVPLSSATDDTFSIISPISHTMSDPSSLSSPTASSFYHTPLPTADGASFSPHHFGFQNDSALSMPLPMPIQGAYLSQHLLDAVFTTTNNNKGQQPPAPPSPNWIGDSPPATGALRQPGYLYCDPAEDNTLIRLKQELKCPPTSSSVSKTAALQSLGVSPQAISRRHQGWGSGPETPPQLTTATSSSSSPAYDLSPIQAPDHAPPTLQQPARFLPMVPMVESLDVASLVIGSWQRNAYSSFGDRELQVTVDKTSGLFQYTTWEQGWAFRITVPFDTLVKISTVAENVIRLSLSHLPVFQVCTMAHFDPPSGLFGAPTENDFTADKQASNVPFHDLYLTPFEAAGVVNTLLEIGQSFPCIAAALGQPGGLADHIVKQQSQLLCTNTTTPVSPRAAKRQASQRLGRQLPEPPLKTTLVDQMQQWCDQAVGLGQQQEKPEA